MPGDSEEPLPNPEFGRLLRCFERLYREQPESWSGIIYRSASERYASSDDLVSGTGARRHGGRWNPPGSFATVYGSLSPETAMAETLQHYRYYGIEPWRMGRRVFTSVEARLSSVVDLTLGRVRQRLRVSADRMRAEDWRRRMDSGHEPITQAIGRAAFAARVEALRVQSAATQDGVNLVIFPDNLSGESRLRELRVEEGARS